MAKKRNRITRNKKVRNATSKVYKGITFRSKLELFAYQKLEEAGIPVLYEKRKYVLQEGFRYEGPSFEHSRSNGFVDNTTKVRDITYTPDFVDPQETWIMEIKGFANDVFPIKWKMFKRHLLDKGTSPPALFLPRNQQQVLEAIAEIQKL